MDIKEYTFRMREFLYNYKVYLRTEGLEKLTDYELASLYNSLYGLVEKLEKEIDYRREM